MRNDKYICCTITVVGRRERERERERERGGGGRSYVYYHSLDPYVITEARKASVGDYDSVFFEEHILSVEILVNDPPSVKVANGLSDLTTNVDAPFKGKGLTPDVDVSVESTTFTEAV